VVVKPRGDEIVEAPGLRGSEQKRTLEQMCLIKSRRRGGAGGTAEELADFRARTVRCVTPGSNLEMKATIPDLFARGGDALNAGSQRKWGWGYIAPISNPAQGNR